MPVTRQPGAPIPNVVPPPGSPPPTPHGGAWTQNSNTGAWTWTQGATPNPSLVSQWGYNALTDNQQDPTGHPNYGTWVPQHGGGWSWQWGEKPDPNLVKTYGNDTLTNRNSTPNGANTTNQNTPPPPNVNPPNLSDNWNGKAPDVTGAGGSGSGQTVSEPPNHPAFVVSPGSIRDAEQVLLTEVDNQISQYNGLKDYVNMSKGQNLYNNGAGYGAIVNPEDQLLLNIGDVLEVAGQFTAMLNSAAQGYAKADIDSFMPSS